ncbi:MAG TPA: histidine phosphatase family protein [Nitrosopumilaceae archaeon]|nr:histidine phosphatase family protein [Nitrosopumilaceae archaeon]
MRFIIFLRHGQAVNNTKRLLAGRSPGVSLTSKGIEQAERIAKFLKPFNISAIYSSPIERAEKTAEIVAKHNSLEYKLDERLIELDMGKFTGMAYDTIFEKHGNVFFKFYDGELEIAHNGVETFVQVKNRVLSIIDHVLKEHNDQNVLLVTHMDPIKAMISTVLKLDANSMFELIIENASLTVFKEYEGKITLSAINLMDSERFDLNL